MLTTLIEKLAAQVGIKSESGIAQLLGYAGCRNF
jgi:hypothetical protein